MSKKNSTIYDVANSAGISIATVSRVLNSPDVVSIKTKEKVYKAMESLGFTPKAEARDRAKRHIGRIGVISPHLTFPSFIHRLKGITTVIDGASFELSMITINDKNDIDQYLKSKELTHRLDGIIVLSMKLNRSTIELLKKLKIKTVFIEFGEEDFTSICVNNFKGGESVAEYLFKKNYTTFAVLTHFDVTQDEVPNKLRVDGFKSKLKELEIILDDNSIFYTTNDLNLAIEEATNILTQTKRPEVIFATTDLLAVAVIKSAKKLNINIPVDLGVIGFDGTTTSEYLDLTTVDQSLEDSGKMAAELLIKSLNEPEQPIQNIFLPLKIIERSTVR
ncbi:MAG: LacI family transcriptional regulator [Spirochaetaceae bacterium]